MLYPQTERPPLATLAILLASIASALAFAAWGGGTALSVLALVPSEGLLQPGLFTYAFVHRDLSHLLSNMAVFVLLAGPVVEAQVRGRGLVLLFIGGSVLGGAVQTGVNPASSYATIGTSTAVMTVLGAAFALSVGRPVCHRYHVGVKKGTVWLHTWPLMVLLLGLQVLGRLGSGGEVAWVGHLSGALVGLVSGLALRQRGPAPAVLSRS